MSQGRKKSNRDSKKIIESDVTGVVKRYIDTGGYGFITEMLHVGMYFFTSLPRFQKIFGDGMTQYELEMR